MSLYQAVTVLKEGPKSGLITDTLIRLSRLPFSSPHVLHDKEEVAEKAVPLEALMKCATFAWHASFEQVACITQALVAYCPSRSPEVLPVLVERSDRDTAKSFGTLLGIVQAGAWLVQENHKDLPIFDAVFPEQLGIIAERSAGSLNYDKWPDGGCAGQFQTAFRGYFPAPDANTGSRRRMVSIQAASRIQGLASKGRSTILHEISKMLSSSIWGSMTPDERLALLATDQSALSTAQATETS